MDSFPHIINRHAIVLHANGRTITRYQPKVLMQHLQPKSASRQNPHPILMSTICWRACMPFSFIHTDQCGERFLDVVETILTRAKLMQQRVQLLFNLLLRRICARRARRPASQFRLLTLGSSRRRLHYSTPMRDMAIPTSTLLHERIAEAFVRICLANLVPTARLGTEFVVRRLHVVVEFCILLVLR